MRRSAKSATSFGIGERAHPMADSLGAENLDRFADAPGTGGFTRVRDAVQTARAREIVGFPVERRRIVRLIAAEADPDDAEPSLGERGREARRLEGALDAEVTRQVADQRHFQIVAAAFFIERLAQGGDGFGDVEIAVKKRPDRRRDEDLGVAHALRGSVVDVVAPDPREVFGRLQRLAYFGEE